MTPKQFEMARRRLGLSQAKLGQACGFGARQARRYEAGDAEIPEPIAKLIRLAVAGRISIEEIAKA